MPVSKADVAVIVPTRNSAATLRVCLRSIKAQNYPCTLVVVDNGSTDATLSIAHEFADIVLTCGPERSAQRNAGAAATSAAIVGFIDSDMELPPTVVSEVVEAFRGGAVSVTVPERTVGEGFWAEVRAFERSFYDGSDTIEAPRFFSRDVFDSVDGFDETLTGPEDWDLGIRTCSSGPRVRINSVILHHEGRVRYLAACRKKGYYGVGLLRFVSKHGASAFVGMSHREWLKHPRAMCTSLGLGLVALKSGESLSVIAAVVRARLAMRLGWRWLSRTEMYRGGRHCP
ncbi:MAG: glycosyltransferase family 2 protein [Ferrimicrobium sp.]